MAPLSALERIHGPQRPERSAGAGVGVAPRIETIVSESVFSTISALVKTADGKLGARSQPLPSCDRLVLDQRNAEYRSHSTAPRPLVRTALRRGEDEPT